MSRTAARKPVAVTADNFVRAESDVYFANIVREGGFGKFHHHRRLPDVANQRTVRPNRDTLYSVAVFDLDGGPVTITLPDAGTRFLALQVFDEDEYVLDLAYRAGSHSYSRESTGTRYILAAIRIQVNPDQADLDKAHALQDSIKVQQRATGHFEVPVWDPHSQGKVRRALLALAETVPDTRAMFGSRDQVDPVRHLIGAAAAWGGHPAKDALQLNVAPRLNDGRTRYRLSVKDVPVDGFWSVTVYNAQGYLESNRADLYSVNSIAACKASDGTINIRFGGDPNRNANCLPIMPCWSYTVRLYRPRSVILNGKWRFPDAMPVQ
jgi:hypothetical protein